MIQAVRNPTSTDAPRVLVVGDADGSIRSALVAAMPAARVETAENAFEAVLALGEGEYAAVLAGLDLVRRRPEAAVRALRQGLGEGSGRRLVLFGGDDLQPLASRLNAAGGDGLLTLPAATGPLLRLLRVADGEERDAPPLLPDESSWAGIVLDAMLDRAGNALAATVEKVASTLSDGATLRLTSRDQAAADDALIAPLSDNEAPARQLVLIPPPDWPSEGRPAALDALSRLAAHLSKLAAIDARHVQLQKFALTDELTECYNRRYFRHFLDSMLKQARRERFPVTLLLFDIDDFKHYNDRHGHALGDEILRQTSALIRRCVRDHDLVARIGGDEFAVVFWEKDAPRVPHDPDSAPGGRFPKGPLQIAARFRRLLAEPDFAALGNTGEGSLTISGGMAVYPFDAQSADDLIEAADKALIFGAKRGGKNSIALVGDDGEGGSY